jgi:hypothetical protein
MFVLVEDAAEVLASSYVEASARLAGLINEYQQPA